MWDCKSGACQASGKIKIEMTMNRLRDRLRPRRMVPQKWDPIDIPENLPLNPAVRRVISDNWMVGNPDRFLLRLGAGELAGRILIPYPRADGAVVYWNSRSLTGELPKYKCMPGPKPLYVPSFYMRDRGWLDLVIVEGPFDAMSIEDRLDGVTAVALGGKTISEQQLLELKSLTHVARSLSIMLDHDALSAALALKHKLDPYVYHTARVAVLQSKDPAVATHDELRDALRF
jgi:hypothetical protein